MSFYVWCQEQYNGVDYSSPYVVRTMKSGDIEDALAVADQKTRQAMRKTQRVTQRFYVTRVHYRPLHEPAKRQQQQPSGSASWAHIDHEYMSMSFQTANGATVCEIC